MLPRFTQNDNDKNNRNPNPKPDIYLFLKDDPETRAKKLLKEMTLDEKIVMMHGSPGPYIGNVPQNTRLGIPALNLNDGTFYYYDIFVTVNQRKDNRFLPILRLLLATNDENRFRHHFCLLLSAVSIYLFLFFPGKSLYTVTCFSYRVVFLETLLFTAD